MADERNVNREAVDVDRIVRGIRDEIRRRHPESELPAWQSPRAPASSAEDGGGLGELPPPAILSPHLRYLNEHWQLDPFFPLRSHRPVVGRLIVLVKHLMRKSVVGLFLPVFQSITAFFSNVTSFSNAIAKNLDDATNRLAADDRQLAARIERVAAERGELVRRIEGGEQALVDRMDLVFQRLDREQLALERRIEDLEGRTSRTDP